MQDQRIRTIASLDCWHLWHPYTNRSMVHTKRLVEGVAPAVPSSPGHARRLRPYPPSSRGQK